MSNDRLRAALAAAGMTPETLADAVGVEPKTVERWIAGRAPYPRHRATIAHALAVSITDLWPDQHPPPAPLDQPVSEEQPSGDLLSVESRSASAEEVSELLSAARHRIELLGLAPPVQLAGVGLAALLGERAEAGCEIRILLSDPDSIHLLTELSEHAPDTEPTADPAWPIERALGYLQPLLTHPKIAARMYVAARPNAIVRADDEMLVALRLFATAPAQEPQLRLRRRDDWGLFARFADHFERIWQHASTPAPVDADLYPDPDEHPDRYHSQAWRPSADAFGVEYDPPTQTPSAAPTSRRRDRR